MQITVPDPDRYAAAFLVSALPNETLATVVVKQSFDLVLQGDGTHNLVPLADAAEHAIAFEDTVATITNTDDDVIGYRPIMEADTAPKKSHTDIAVLGLGSSGSGGAVHVDGAVWMVRQTRSYTDDKDAIENLFGFQAKGSNTRGIGSVVSNSFPDLPLPEGTALTPAETQAIADAQIAWRPQYTSHFNNFHRRGDGFSFFGSGPALSSNQLIEVFQTPDASDTPKRYLLPDLSLKARYRFHSGHCPDKPHRWAFVWLNAVEADTIVFDIPNARAFVLWRASWPFTDQPADAYRQIEILKAVA
ncbi:MAG: hypothetical protein AAGK92_00815 [Pseudomonadota bacterium]